ncbi:MAG: glycine cleavage system protein GcvH [Oscillospiraceae bacterium]
MNIPEKLRYSKTHEWVEDCGQTVKIGISDFAQDALGDLVFVNLPEEGDELIMGESFADVESVKAVSDLYAPVSGVVVAINEELLNNPETINESPYEAWLIEVGSVSEKAELMDAKAYKLHCESEEH